MSHTTTTVVTRQVTSSGGTTHVSTGNRDWNTGVLSCTQDCKNCTVTLSRYAALWPAALSVSTHPSVRLFACLSVRPSHGHMPLIFSKQESNRNF